MPKTNHFQKCCTFHKEHAVAFSSKYNTATFPASDAASKQKDRVSLPYPYFKWKVYLQNYKYKLIPPRNIRVWLIKRSQPPSKLHPQLNRNSFEVGPRKVSILQTWARAFTRCCSRVSSKWQSTLANLAVTVPSAADFEERKGSYNKFKVNITTHNSNFSLYLFLKSQWSVAQFCTCVSVPWGGRRRSPDRRPRK